MRYSIPQPEDASDAEAKEANQTVREIFSNRLDATGVKDVVIRPVGKLPGRGRHPRDPVQRSGRLQGDLCRASDDLEFRLQAWTEAGINVDTEQQKFDTELQRRQDASERLTRSTDLSFLTENVKFEGQGVTFRWLPMSEKYAKEYCKNRNVDVRGRTKTFGATGL